MKEEYGMLPENGFVADSDTPFSLFGEKIDEARQTLNRRIAIARVKRQGRRIHMEEVAPGVSISVPELETEKCAGAWEEERDKGWNENIQPGASVQWYQEGSRSPNLGEVIEIDPEYQTYKVRDAYTGEVSVQTKVKIFSKKKSGGFDPHAPGESIGQSQLWDEEPYALFEQGGKYYKVPLNDPMTDAGWSNVEEIDAEELARLKGEEPMTGLAKRAISKQGETAAGSWEMSDEKKLFDYYREARDSGAPLDTLEDFRNAIPDPTWQKYLPLNESTYPQFKVDAEAYADHASDWMEKGYESGRIAAFDESKHPRASDGEFGAGGGTESAEPGSDEFMSRMLEVGPGPGDKVRLKDGTETEWSEDVQDQIDSWMPDMGPQQWFANKGARRSSKFAEEEIANPGLLSQYQPFAALSHLPWMADRYPNEQWKLIWIYDDAAFTSGELSFPSQEEAMQYLEEMAAEGLIRKTGVLKRATEEYPEEGDSPKADECPACSGKGEEIDSGVYSCEECRGLFGEVASEQDALQWVNFKEWDDSPSDNQRYFDFSWPGGRAHGWYNEATGKMTQSG